jgi:hypothetical protein
VVRMILPRAIPSRAVPPTHLFETGAYNLFTLWRKVVTQRVFIAFVLLLVPIASAQVYTVTDLGPLSRTGINRLGPSSRQLQQPGVYRDFGPHARLGKLQGGTFRTG